MLKKLILLPFILTASVASQAQTAATCSSVTSCLQESYRQNRPRLPYYIHEKAQNCALYPQGKTAYQKCQAEIIDFSRQVLSCNVDANRFAETEKYDKKLLQNIINDNGGEVAVPEEIQKVFAHLIQTAEKNFSFSVKKPVWKLRAYASKTPNAHAGASGEILINSYFWDPNANFTLSEIAGIIGHEISHVITRDSLNLGCLAHEWVGSDIPLSIEELTTIFREDLSPSIPRGKQWSDLSQSLEMNADKNAKRLLELAGYDSASMAHALQKLQGAVSEGFSTGSHPGFTSRLQNLK